MQLVIPQAPEELLQHLLDFGKEWRESKLPASLRADSVFGATVTKSPNGFRMTLEHGRREPHFELHAVIVPSGADTIVQGHVTLVWWNRVWVGVIAIAIVALFAASSYPSEWFAATVFTILGESMLLFVLLSAHRRAESEFSLLVTHAAGRAWRDVA